MMDRTDGGKHVAPELHMRSNAVIRESQTALLRPSIIQLPSPSPRLLLVVVGTVVVVVVVDRLRLLVLLRVCSAGSSTRNVQKKKKMTPRPCKCSAEPVRAYMSGALTSTTQCITKSMVAAWRMMVARALHL